MTPTMSRDAAMVLGLAATALPFAGTPEDEVERWLRILRFHGAVAGPLQAAGVGEAPLRHAHRPIGSRGLDRGARESDAVERVTDQAARVASDRGAPDVGTPDVLRAVMDVYGEDFDRVLGAYATDRGEVLERLEAAHCG